jgi:hypothetical protein
MPNKSYSPDFKLRAVALASVRSVPIASKELGVPEDTLTRWVAKEPPSAGLERAVNLALSELTVRMAAGTLSPRDLTVAYGVLRDKQARYGRVDTAPPITDADKWGDDLEKALHKRYGSDADLALALALPWFDAMLDDAEGPSVADTLRHIASLGDLHATRQRRIAASHEAMLVQIERNRQAAIAFERKALDDETRALVAEAEAWLAANAEPAP